MTDDELKREKVRILPLNAVDDFPDYPFHVKNDESMELLIQSIQNNGVLTPVIARRKEDDRYELISGHRRKKACELLGMELIPVIVRDMSRDEAVIEMVDSNLQREHILPSEKAFAYKMKMDAMKRQGKRMDLTCAPLVHKLNGEKTRDIIAAENGESHEQVRRYIRLTELIPELLELVDDEKIGFRPAVELSYLQEEEQRDLLETIESEEATPSLAQAVRMKKLSQEGILDMDTIFAVMTEEKANQKEKVKLSMERFERFFARGTPPKQIEDTIYAALEYYQRSISRRRSIGAGRDAR